MPRLLLDTHIWLWLLLGDKRLSSSMIDLIEKASSVGGVYISPISIWEIAMLEAQNRIHLGKDIHQWVEDAITVSGVKQTELTPQVLIDSTKLPGNFHKDPADRMIIATSRANGLLLLTQDERILAYSQEGYVNTVR